MKIRYLIPLLSIIPVLLVGMAFGATHYVDYTTGSDSNNGTSTSTPWKHAPGMQGLTPSGSSTGDGCTGNCASYTPAAGDFIILKGGTVWPYTTMPWVWNWAGSGSTSKYGCVGTGCIYVGNAVGAGLSAWNSGTVTGIWIKRDLGGWNPASPPTISCAGGGGSGAAATPYVVPAAETNDPAIAGALYNVALTNTGSSYTSAPTCTISGGGGTATLGTDIDRAIIDWGATQGSPPNWQLGNGTSCPGTTCPGILVEQPYVIWSGLETRNMKVASPNSTEEQSFYFNLFGNNVTLSNIFSHGAYTDCVAGSSCNSVDVNHFAFDLDSPYDEASHDIVENGDVVVLGNGSNGCTTNILCGMWAFGYGTGTQGGNGPVSVHDSIGYSNAWQLRYAGSNASGSGTDPYLSYNNEFFMTVYQLNNTAHINSRYMQLNNVATLYSYNNVVHSQVAGASSQIQCPASVNYYYFNETMWNIGGGTQAYSLDMNDVGGAGGCTLTLYNDTMQQASSSYCVDSQTGSNTTNIVMQNLFCISNSAANPFWQTGVTNSVYKNYTGSTTQATIQASSVSDSLSTANSQGYVPANLYAPTLSSNDTVTFASGGGTANLTSQCGGYLTALCLDINGNARPSSGGWQAGAFQFTSGSTYTITISSITGNGTVTSSDSVINCTTGTTGTCSDTTATGTVTLTETPAVGYNFTSWGGGTCSGSSSTCIVTGTATVTATFSLIVVPPAPASMFAMGRFQVQGLGSISVSIQ
jgi:hypothetical protein